MCNPGFVLMFMPIEPAYIEAMKHNKDLFEYGYKKGIVLFLHTTLTPILRTVSNLWMIERSSAESRKISENTGEIYNRVCIATERLGKLDVTLNIVSIHYNETVKDWLEIRVSTSMWSVSTSFQPKSVKICRRWRLLTWILKASGRRRKPLTKPPSQPKPCCCSPNNYPK